MTNIARYGALAGRVLLAAIFVCSGLMKLAGPAATAAYIAAQGLPIPMALAVGAGILGFVAGMLLLTGYRVEWAALALAAYLVVVTPIFHNPIGLADEEAQLQCIHALKNLAIVGGLLLAAASGRGPISAESRLERE